MDHDSIDPRDERDTRPEQPAEEDPVEEDSVEEDFAPVDSVEEDPAGADSAPVEAAEADSDSAPARGRSPVVPDNGFTRESYAIHATRSELPLFTTALNGRRDDVGWLSSLSSVLAGPDGPIGSVDSTAAAAQVAIDRRTPRQSDDSDS
ncbi:hypothetical protein C5C00_07265 [Rathayibacter rathayi]|uniref:hypothetical protein n=1 Tax=Rathayibacter rathayi TaxID=33887 RepID=UPI000CE8632B|nr:hypothetical protein [Rathayibacter rathayi]PPG97189.1 hypothetical protein C5C00_07265 [Rathayibacter rathayi]